MVKKNKKCLVGPIFWEDGACRVLPSWPGQAFGNPTVQISEQVFNTLAFSLSPFGDEEPYNQVKYRFHPRLSFAWLISLRSPQIEGHQ
jgi:hypothetical protein